MSIELMLSKKKYDEKLKLMKVIFEQRGKDDLPEN
jgi:hypothetical protein